MKKVLITGIAGFVGYHLSEYLKKFEEYKVYGTKLEFEECSLDGAEVVNMDVTNFDNVYAVLDSIRPDYIIHLAAQSSVKFSWDNPAKTVDINVIGTINLLEAIRKLEIKPRVLLVGSSEEYGSTFKEISAPKEESKCIPENMYALTKNFQNNIGYLYSKAYGIDIVMTRSFNHFGVKQAPMFVISDFCRQVALIEAGKCEPVMYVGNLESSRDFLNVKDVVVAYTMLMEKGKSGNTYNIGSGKSYKIKDILDEIISMSDCDIEVKIDPNKYRAIDIEKTRADISKMQSEFDFRPELDMRNGLLEVLNYWRNNIEK